MGIVRKDEMIRNLREQIGDYFGVKYVSLVSSGKAAFLLALLALREDSDRDEVVIPAYTCYSVPSSIVKAGLKVRLCDIHPETLDFDFELLKKSVSSRTLCIVPIHLFGIPSDVDRVKEIAGSHGAAIVEDAAQSMGGTFRGRKLGTLGDIGFFSLGRGKNITAGSGGILLTGSERWGQAIARRVCDWEDPGLGKEITTLLEAALMTLLLDPRLYWIPETLPFLKLGETMFHRDFPCLRMGGVQAGLLRNWRKKLAQSNREHRETAYGLLRMLFGKNGSFQPQLDPDNVYLRLPVLSSSGAVKNRLLSAPDARRLGMRSMYPASIRAIPEIREMVHDQSCPSADSVAERLFTLPTHRLVSLRDRERIRGILGSEDPTSFVIPARAS